MSKSSDPPPVPKYRKHKQSGRAIVTLSIRQGDQITRRDVLLGPHGTPQSYQEYNRVVSEWLASNGTAQPPPLAAAGGAAAVTVGELIVRFFEKHVQTYYRHADGQPTTEPENFRQALRSLKALYQDLPVREFTPPKLRTWQLEVTKPMRTVLDPLTGEPRQVRGWARSNANKHIARVKQMFKWGMGEPIEPDSLHMIVPPDVYTALSAVSGLKKNRCHARETEKVKPVPEIYVAAVLPFLSAQVRAMVQLQILTGARPGEIAGMTSAQIDTTGKQWVYRPAHHKTEHHDVVREIPIGARARGVLEPFLKRELSAYLFSPKEAEAQRLAALHALRTTPANEGNRPGYHDSTRSGQPRRMLNDFYSVDSYRGAVERACDKADRWAKGARVIGNDERLVPRWHPHQLRHNAATKIRAEFPEFALEAAGAVLGHKTVSATLIYAERNARLAELVASKIG
jgi:integrase